MNTRTLISVALVAVALPAAAQAQVVSPFSVEARAGAVIPIGDFADSEFGGANTGFGFGVNAAYRVIPMLDVYAGYNWHRFRLDDDPEFDNVDVDLDDSGFEIGARVFVPMTGSIAPWLQGGLILHQLKVGGSEGGISASLTSDRAAGFEVGGGIAVPLSPSLFITPGVRYRQYSAKFDLGSFGADSIDVQYFATDIGVQFRF